MTIETETNKAKNMILADIENGQAVIFEGLLHNNTVNSLPESIFVNYFLPCFLGKTQNTNWMLEWVSIAGTPMAQVAVFKDNTTEVLFNVPGLLQTNSLLMNSKGPNISDIFARYDQINNNAPTSSLSFLMNALNSKNKDIVDSVEANPVNSAWYTILKRYNLVNEEQVQKTTDASSQDYFDY